MEAPNHPEVKDASNNERPARRPQRGRGRGRGGLYRRQHQQEEPSKEVSIDKFSPENLDKLMGQDFPVSSVAINIVNDTMIDTNGYANLCTQTYSQIMFEEKTVQAKLSYSEFMLVMGWLLARRVHQIRKDFYGEEIYADDLMFVIPDDIMVPGPIQMALESLGISKLVNGTTVVPDMALPRFDFKERYEQGVQSSTSSVGFQGYVEQSMANMFPFGMHMRRVLMNLGDNYHWGNQWNVRFNPERASDGRVDLPFANRGRLPGLYESYDGNEERVHGYDHTAFSTKQGVLGSVCYNGTLLRSYFSFVEYSKKYISYSTFSKVKTSSCAILGFVQSGENAPNCNVYRVFSAYTLNKWEQHAARIFKWRRLIDDAHDPTGNCAAWLRIREMPSLYETNNEITPIKSDRDMISFFISSFIVSKAKTLLM